MRYALFIIALSLAACEPVRVPDTPQQRPEAPKPVSLDKTEWIATSVNGEPLVEGTNITATFATDGLGGYDGCNWYGARMTVSGDAMKIERAESTARGCLKPGVEAQSAAFHNALTNVARYRATPQRLELLDSMGRVLLAFTARPRYTMNPADLIGTAWKLANKPEVTLAFADGTTSGFGGCREYTGTYTARDDHIRFTSIAMKEMECSRGLRAQRAEEELTTHFSETTHYRMHDGKLTLFTDPGHTLEFIRAR